MHILQLQVLHAVRVAFHVMRFVVCVFMASQVFLERC